MDGITDSVDMTLRKLQEMVKNREACSSSVHGITELDTTEQLNNNSNNNKGRLETVEGVFEKVLIQWPKLFFLHM